MIAVFLHIVFTGGGKDEKRKILQPILFALALVMVFSVLGVTPAYAGCRSYS